LGLGLGHVFLCDDPSLSTHLDDPKMENLGSVSAEEVIRMTRMTLDDPAGGVIRMTLDDPLYLEEPRWVG